MSEWFKKNMIMVIINALILLIISVIGYNVQAAVSTINQKADRAEVEANKKYIDDTIINHETKEQLIFNNINNAILEIKQNNKDARTEYLIQIQLLRKDILDLYKSK